MPARRRLAYLIYSGSILLPLLGILVAVAATMRISSAGSTDARAESGFSATLDVAPATFGQNRFLLTLHGTRFAPSGPLTIDLRPVMLTMPMNAETFTAYPVGNGRYQAVGLLAMPGSWHVDVAVAGRVVPGGARHFGFPLIVGAQQKPLPPLLPTLAGSSAPKYKAAALPAPAAVSWAGLPYRGIVTFLAGSQIYVPGHATLLQDGVLGTGINHSISRVPGRDEAWVTDYGDDRVAVIDLKHGTLLKTIPVGLGPVHVAFDARGTRAWVTDYTSSEVSVIDVATRKVIKTVQVGLFPHGLALSPDGRQVWVACANAGTITVLDSRTSAIIDQAPAGIGPHAVAFSPDGRTVYMTDFRSSSLVILDAATRSIVGTVPIGTGSAMDAVSPDGRFVYVTGQAGGVVSVVDTRSQRVVAPIPVGQAPHGLSLTPDGRYLYVAVNNANWVAVIDTATRKVARLVPVPGAADELILVR